MTSTNTYDPKTTALLCIDFYNDFLSEGGKFWPGVKDMARRGTCSTISASSCAPRGNSASRSTTSRTILTGLLANTCLEATGRIGMELGYHVTLVRDGTAARSPEAMHAAMNIDGPTYAHAILTTTELIAALKS